MHRVSAPLEPLAPRSRGSSGRSRRVAQFGAICCTSGTESSRSVLSVPAAEQAALQAANGQTNVRLLAADASALPLDRGYDRVLADVPCSGTGTFARNPEIKWRLKPADLVDRRPDVESARRNVEKAEADISERNTKIMLLGAEINAKDSEIVDLQDFRPAP